MNEKQPSTGPGSCRALAVALTALAVFVLQGVRLSAGESLDLSRVEVCPSSSGPVEQNAAAMLRDEIATRTRIHLPMCAGGPAADRTTIRIGTAERIGALPALKRAEAILDRADGLHAAPDWRARTFELAEALFQSIRMQLSVPRYAARSIRRGGTLDLIDVPLNDRVELKRQFEAIRALDSEETRLGEIATITAERYHRKLEYDEEVYQAGIQ
jgi:hypothetical protein